MPEPPRLGGCLSRLLENFLLLLGLVAPFRHLQSVSFMDTQMHSVRLLIN